MFFFLYLFAVKPCPLPEDTPNGYYQLTSGEDFVFGATIKYFCNEGYVQLTWFRYFFLSRVSGWSSMCKCIQLSKQSISSTERVLRSGGCTTGRHTTMFFNSWGHFWWLPWKCFRYQMVSRNDTRKCLLDMWTNRVPVCECKFENVALLTKLENVSVKPVSTLTQQREWQRFAI